jgi:hypothetical protein
MQTQFCLQLATSDGGGNKKGVERVNIVKVFYTHV